MMSKYVNLEIALTAGFNYFEPSLAFETEKRHCIAHLSYIPEKDLNLAVIEAREKGSDDRRIELYFEAFKGKRLAERSGNEIKEFHDHLKSIVSRKYLVAGRDLEKIILRTIK